MARLILVLTATICLSSAVLADVLVQPGYGQPHPVVQPPETIRQPSDEQQNPIHQPRESSSMGQHDADQLTRLLTEQQQLTPYHLELHPIYTDESQSHGQIVGYPLLHYPHLTPLSSRYIPRRRLHYTKLGGLGFLGPSVFVSHPHSPLAVHHRYGRSIEDESGSGSKTVESKDDVATKPSLEENVSPVVALKDQDGGATTDLEEKRVETRQSKNDHEITGDSLLGLNPERMYPGYHRYRSVPEVSRSIENNGRSEFPRNRGDSEIVQSIHKQAYKEHEGPSSRMNVHEASRQRESTDQNSLPRVNSEDLQHALMLQATHNQEQHSARQNSQDPNFNRQSMSNEMIRSNDVNSMSRDDQEYTNGDSDLKVSSSSPNSYKPMQRNFPDPRPNPPTARPRHDQDYTPTERSHHHNSANAIVGTSKSGKLRKLHKLKIPHAVAVVQQPCSCGYTYYQYVPQESCDCPCASNPGYAIYNMEGRSSSNTDVLQPSLSSSPQYYQVLSSPTGSTVPKTKYIVMPQSYNNYDGNYGARMVTLPSSAPSVRYYVKNSVDRPTVIYR